MRVQADIRAGKAERVAATVKPLVMLRHDGKGFAKSGNRIENADAGIDVLAHDRHFFVCKPAGLVQDCWRCADLADVVQQPAHPHDLKILGGKPHALSNTNRQFRHPLRVTAGPLRLRIDGPGERGKSAELQFFEGPDQACVRQGDCQLVGNLPRPLRIVR